MRETIDQFLHTEEIKLPTSIRVVILLIILILLGVVYANVPSIQ